MTKKAVFTGLFVIIGLFLAGCSGTDSSVSDNSTPETIDTGSEIAWISVSQLFTEYPPSSLKPYTLLYFTDDSCADGLLMDFYTFTDPDVIRILNRYYNPARISTSDDSLIVFSDSSMTGNQLFQLYNLVGVPSFLILDSENRYFKRIQAGYYPAEDFGLILLETAQ